MHPSDQTDKDPVAFAKGLISQIFLDFTSTALNGNFELHFSLWSEGIQLTEEFSIEIPAQPNTIRRALFKDVEVDEKTMLICRVILLGSDKLNIRTPYAVGCMPLIEALENSADKMLFYNAPEPLLIDGPHQLSSKVVPPGFEQRPPSEVAICATLTQREGLFEEVMQFCSARHSHMQSHEAWRDSSS